jgi:hypothetical protein
MRVPCHAGLQANDLILLGKISSGGHDLLAVAAAKLPPAADFAGSFTFY